jgi:hypothetical protein
LLNAWQAEAFARQFGLPLIKWPITTNLPFDGDYERLLQHEPGLWGYFVEGAPAYLTQTISSPRKLANGSPALLRSLTFAGGAVPAAVQAAYARGGFQVVELKPEDAPQYVNVIVGGTDAAPHDALFWRVGKKNAVRQGAWKLVRDGGAWQLFNLAHDIGEAKDLAPGEAKRVAELSSLWKEWDAQQVAPLWK